MTSPTSPTSPTRGTIRPIRYLGDPVLRTPTDPVPSFDDDLRRLVDDMFASMYAAEGVGLAANQIGICRSVFVYDAPDADGVRHVGTVVNPVLVSTAGEIDDEYVEGCLSMPGLHYENARPAWAAVEGFDVDGEPVRVAGGGTLGRALQHEADHLHGTLFFDHLRGRIKRKAMREALAADWAQPR